MKQTIKTPTLRNCVCCGYKAEVIRAYGPNHYDINYTVQCSNCDRQWPRNTSTTHRAICRWNTRQEKLLSSLKN